MIYRVIAVYDKKAQMYPRPPFCMQSRVEAIRGFTDAVNKDDSPIAAFPSEFDLVEVGTFDSETGALTSEIVVLCNGQEAKKA